MAVEASEKRHFLTRPPNITVHSNIQSPRSVGYPKIGALPTLLRTGMSGRITLLQDVGGFLGILTLS